MRYIFSTIENIADNHQVITAEAPQVVVKEDTLEYNSTAYRTPEGAMLEELVKKLPGAEIDDDVTSKSMVKK